MSAILALDQGTTSSRAIVFDHAGSVLAVAQEEFRQIFPKSGFVEHDPREIWETQLATARTALAKARIAARDVAAIGISNQRETTVVWNRATGEPICNAIVWQDRRTSMACDALRAGGHVRVIQERTGLVIDPYFSGTKLAWILDHIPDARRLAESGKLAFGTIDTWLVWNLTGGAAHVTDVTNASRTMLWNLHTGTWDNEMLRLLDIPVDVLPEVHASSRLVAETAPGLFDAPIKIAGIAGDQQAALFGQNCFSPGLAKNTYGTGCFLLMHIGDKPLVSKSGLLTTAACKTGKQNEFALEGSVFVGGAVVQWLRDGLGIIKTSAEIESLAGSVPDSGGVYLVPAFAGLGAPHWDPYARGTITGLTRGSTGAHLARAALDGIAFQVADLLALVTEDSGVAMTELRVDGGACANNLLMQCQADLLQVPVVRPKIIETTALGAAYLAGLATGFWKDLSEVQRVWQLDRIFEPRKSADEAAHRRGRWHEALRRARHWEENPEAKND